MSAYVGSHTDNNIGNDVSANEIVFTLSLSDKVGNSALDKANAVIVAVSLSRADSVSVDIEGIDIGSAKLSRDDSENTATCSNVQNAGSRLQILLNKGSAETGSLVGTGTECHTGIHSDDYLVLSGGVFLPCGNHYNAVTDVNGLIILFPVIRPIALLNADCLDGSVNSGYAKSVAEESNSLGNASGLRKEHGDSRLLGILLKYLLIEKLAVYSVYALANVAVVLDHKTVVHHSRDRANGVKIDNITIYLYLSPKLLVILFHNFTTFTHILKFLVGLPVGPSTAKLPFIAVYFFLNSLVSLSRKL